MRPWALLPLLLACCTSGVQAGTVHCIVDEAQLRAELVALGGFASGDHDLRLVQRVFFNGTQVFEIAQVGSNVGELRLSGGWNAGCTAQTPDPRQTVLDAQGLSAVLSIRRNSAISGTSPPIAVSNLTLRNGQAANAPIGLGVYNGFGSIEVDDVIVHGHRATASNYSGGTAITLDSSRNDIRLRNALVYDNAGTDAWGGALVDVLFTSLSLNPERRWTVTNSTVVSGPRDRALRLQSDGHFDLFNNVIRGEVRYDPTITGAGAATAPRVRQAFNHMPEPVGDDWHHFELDLDTGNDSGDPRLDPLTREPLPGSPVINTGLGNPPGGQSTTDAFGRPRVAFTYIDRGALESQSDPDPIFRNGFD